LVEITHLHRQQVGIRFTFQFEILPDDSLRSHTNSMVRHHVKRYGFAASVILTSATGMYPVSVADGIRIAYRFGLQSESSFAGLAATGVLVAIHDGSCVSVTRRQGGSSVSPHQRSLLWFPVSVPFQRTPESAVLGGAQW